MAQPNLPSVTTVKDRWEDFEEWANLILAEYARRCTGDLYVSEPVFRGQADANWPLTTTLERALPTGNCVKAHDYYLRAYSAKHSIESHTGQRWDLASPGEYANALPTRYRWSPAVAGKELEYLVYLRHHGFPSPLLDWSASPYVAAYFAFVGASPRADRVAICAYMEHAGDGKGGWSAEADITCIGHQITTDRRHHLQRSHYTHCMQEEGGDWFYVSHEEIFQRQRLREAEPQQAASEQDLLWVITMPAIERDRALRYLDRFNLNAYSLFGSEDALLETVAFRELADWK